MSHPLHLPHYPLVILQPLWYIHSLSSQPLKYWGSPGLCLWAVSFSCSLGNLSHFRSCTIAYTMMTPNLHVYPKSLPAPELYINCLVHISHRVSLRTSYSIGMRTPLTFPDYHHTAPLLYSWLSDVIHVRNVEVSSPLSRTCFPHSIAYRNLPITSCLAHSSRKEQRWTERAFCW